MVKRFSRSLSALTAFLIMAMVIAASAPVFSVSAEEVQTIVTEYEDLWTGNITVKVGAPVKWYVNVPAGTEPKGCRATIKIPDLEPKGCRATIKIPDLGWGTDTHNKDEGHLVLTEGENFVYEFTPEETGDILFCCWMGSGCHKNYIHVVDDTTEPNDDSTANPDSEQTDSSSSADDDPSKTDDTSSNADSDNSTDEIQEIITEYDDLWTGNITVKVGVPVKWYVNVPAGTALMGCERTIKIPGLGWGTDSHNKNEGHLTLEEGKNFVYEFTPEETGDILFTCWMGSACHYNYIHVTSDGIADPNAEKGGKRTDTDTGSSENSGVSTSENKKTVNSAANTSNPNTGDNSPLVFVITAIISASAAFAAEKK
ncbi:hypothetical protein [uncultured Ruminococcus sp.]|uniref:hypothetical protein n=1 Tax=uncultured Ruminococcus sp. TaxID=165186 RepID=UPI0025DB283B|nr:hypothetical protein [uncultured Ruminococcus sp.]